MENNIITPPLEAGQNVLTASGGWVSHPLLYDMFPPPIDTHPFKLPMFTTQRGEITFNTGSTWSSSKDEQKLLSSKLTKDERLLTMAMGVALTSKCRFRHGAIVVKHSKILGSSPNVYKNNPKVVDPKNCSIHAEIRAMLRAGSPKGCTLYVARMSNVGPKLSRPCQVCYNELMELKVKRVFYTTNEGYTCEELR